MIDMASLENTARLIEQTSRAIHAVGHREGLFPAQWAALRYFRQAPAEAHTVADLARFQHLQRGTVARTVRVLMEKGLLKLRTDRDDDTVERIEITPGGADALRHDPHLDLFAALRDLPPDRIEGLTRGLAAFLDRFEAVRRDHR
ncbi:DNA-binding MarR family transcriptional regulator [Azospirillum agricola]|uniref:MarR family winged helix-turn-helix transcriptional regulator n=1 Tax=Azospirillum agricola TaxID=1720247 RepID=UPI001AE7D2DD|nr:MarR family transcriptional regulator [Azospirillum agricola]MBP2227757.1 DNA-binding MarR family transcriptional regulator [Azospirillum agricola]